MKLISVDMSKHTSKTNYYKLKRWYEELNDYEKLSIKEAKELNKLMLESSGDIKKIYRNRLILGTIYLIYNFICNSGLTAIKYLYFDIDDIMNTGIEIWINMIDSNMLLNENIEYFHRLFTKEFYVRLNKHMIGENTKYYSNEKIYNLFDEFVFGNILKYYLDCINNGSIVDEKSEFNCILHCLEETQILRKISSFDLSKEEKQKLIYHIYLLFHNIKNIINIEAISKLSKTKLEYLKLILFEASIFDKSASIISREDFISEIDDKILASTFLENETLTKREKEVLMLRYNIDGKYCQLIDPQFREIASFLGISRSRAHQLENKGIRKIKSYYSI